MSDFKQPISIYFVWHENASSQVMPIIKFFDSLLSRDSNKPFSRAINIPIFYELASSSPPVNLEITSIKTIAYFFICDDVLSNSSWRDYIIKNSLNTSVYSVFIGISNYASKLTSYLENANLIRMNQIILEHDNYVSEYMFVSLCNELYRYLVFDSQAEDKSLDETVLKIFLSHSKYDEEGKSLALRLKNFIDYSNMNNFFDAYDIQAGSNFIKSIMRNIEDSTFIGISTDTYSSRYWCQREVIHAKESNRPMILIDMLKESEDRRFPHASNVPIVHVSTERSFDDAICLNILITALIETIRWNYSQQLLNQFTGLTFDKSEVSFSMRPPDFIELNRLESNSDGTPGFNKRKIIYPDPPVYNEEIRFLSKLNVEVSTPIEILAASIKNLNIGLSISEPSYMNDVQEFFEKKRLKKLSQDIARYLLVSGSSLLYGGDLRDDGFTRFILNEASALKYLCPSAPIKVVNFVAWPIFLDEKYNYSEVASEYLDVAETELIQPAESIKAFVNEKEFLAYNNDPKNHLFWSESLTYMRKELIKRTNARIIVGGKYYGYKGSMPGLLEEFALSVEREIPIYLLGGFGGITELICKSIEEGKIDEILTLEWQLNDDKVVKLFNEAYKYRLDYREKYKSIFDLLKIENLRNGLTMDENLKLFKTRYTEEALLLILTGLSRLK